MEKLEPFYTVIWMYHGAAAMETSMTAPQKN
jgi:hypothetical protein